MEVEKDLRLPTGVKSWWQLLHQVPGQDGLPLHHRTDNIKFYIPGEMHLDDWHITESFVGDILTVKSRGFDEIKEIIPDRNTLIEMYHEVLNGTLGRGEKTCNFLQKLIDLT